MRKIPLRCSSVLLPRTALSVSQQIRKPATGYVSMGKQKQQRRSAKKKQKGGGGGGHKKADVTKNEARDETIPTLKCTACRQVVTPDSSIACPVPECDRIFCTKKCASSCIVRCANEGCLCPERCRPCASGTTISLLIRRNVKRGDYGHNWSDLSKKLFFDVKRGDYGHNWSDLSKTLFFGCAACKDTVCTRCASQCTTCMKLLCLCCAGSQCMVACSRSTCQAKYCSSGCLPDSHDTSWSACGKCIAFGAIVVQENREVGVVKGKDVDEVVLDYAECVSDCFRLIIHMSELRPSYPSVVPADKAENILERMELIDKVLGPSQQITNEMACIRINDVAQRYFKEVREQGLESRAASCCDEIMAALLPDITASLEAFSQLNYFLSCKDKIVSLEKLQLDTMQRLFCRKLCGHCFRRVNNASPQRCGGCKAVYYCDESCHSLSWPAHSHLCSKMKSARGVFNSRILDKREPSAEV